MRPGSARAAVVAVLAALTFAVPAGAQALTTPATLTIHVSPTGDDASLGQSADRPVRTLARAQSIAQHTRRDRALVVLVAGGTYTEWGVRWYNHHPTLPTTIRASGVGGRPVFSGRGASGFGLTVRPGAYADMRLTISGVTFADGSNGVQVSTATGVTFRNVGWKRIGSRYATGGHGVGALHLSNADGVRVLGGTFVNVENTGSAGPLVHAVYATAGSTRLEVRSSRFSTVSGDPVRLRHGSHGAVVATSTFARAGSKAIMSDWYAGATEMPSVSARIAYSTLGPGYDGRPLPAAFCFDTARVCDPERISAFGNTTP